MTRRINRRMVLINLDRIFLRNGSDSKAISRGEILVVMRSSFSIEARAARHEQATLCTQGIEEKQANKP
jgi:hypothetical protein